MASASEDSVAMQVRTNFGMNVYSSMRELSNLEYESWTKWKNDVELILAMMDLDLALLEPKPTKSTHTLTPEEKAKCEKWERSNRISLMLMRNKMADHVRSFVPQSDEAKQYLAGIENLVLQIEEKSSHILYGKLTKAKYVIGEGNVGEHILKMCSIVDRIRGCGEKICDELLVLIVVLSLPSQFDHVKKSALQMGWKLNDVIAECSRLEKYLIQENRTSLI
ncbi:uncharacterized protein LOC123206419 [Mangifera indica]|uniref:uncharacterized protein LOC123194435 n=1 Tax=Mangifera indica TaxID=29780 RepID=UPI001CFB5163|nr:uncharacterized protein LOC123194435 [Mangifera indica]XP_044479542.1 uncharacterized protein LOC123206419 [Mangifera indica]